MSATKFLLPGKNPQSSILPKGEPLSSERTPQRQQESLDLPFFSVNSPSVGMPLQPVSSRQMALNRHVCLHSQICQALILRVCLCLLTLESTNFKSSRICNYELFNCNYFNKLLATAESLMSHCPWKMPATAVAYGCRGCMLHYILATDTDSVT